MSEAIGTLGTTLTRRAQHIAQVQDVSGYYRCRGCSMPAVSADEVEAELCRRIARAILPADIVELAREELRQRLALPRDGTTRGAASASGVSSPRRGAESPSVPDGSCRCKWTDA